ncbi:hypothetical protein GCM10020360_28240 [Nonlabens tegetincola]
MTLTSARVYRETHHWRWDTLQELTHDLRISAPADEIGFHLEITEATSTALTPSILMQVNIAGDSTGRGTEVSVSAPDRFTAEAVHTQIVLILQSSTPIPERNPAKETEVKPKIFIGHGRNEQWRALKEHLQDHHGFSVRAFETGSRAGHTIRDILDSELDNANFAFIVMTGEDEQGDGALRARQNVVHEAGLFQGKMGFDRAIIVLEEGVENFSNVDGVQYIPFARGNIREAFGDAAATIKRVFNL